MKDFLKMFLAVVCGLVIVGIVGLMMFCGFIGALASLGSETPVIPRSGILDLNFDKISISEQSQDIDITARLKGDESISVGLWDAVQSIKAAASDPAVQYIFLRADGVSAGQAQIEELRQALSDFRKSGKAVVAFLNSPSTASYYLSSVADKVYMGKYSDGAGTFLGVGTQLIFLKDILDKVGVNVQLIRHGKYKSAGEMYIKNKPSEENLEQNQVMINSIWNNYAERICESRGLTKAQLNDLLDNLKLASPADYLANSLVDELLTKEELKDKLASLAVEESYNELKFISLPDYIAAKAAVAKKPSKKNIAILFAEGEIVDGDDKEQVAGDRFAEEIAKVRADSTVKAVVFRVASPGGSVLASEKIKQEIDLLRKDKPVIASYGDYAASGGYWISNSCDKIFSDASTLTGSIGVFSMIPDFSKTAKDLLHVNITSVCSNRHSDMYSMMRPLDTQEVESMQKSVNNIYGEFLKNVASGRNMTEEAVDEIAQGRVWAGSDALKIGLVDEIGTLSDAVAFAAVAAGDADVDSWQITCLPKPQTMLEKLMESFSGSSSVFAGTPFESIENAYRSWDWNSSEKVFARIPYAIDIQK